MSNKKQKNLEKRPYKLKTRAKRRDEVHLKITEAAVFFHGTVGPARTTMGEIAKRAGVRRATVYNHFPTELELIDACSSHWFNNNPPPNPSLWIEISDPDHRTKIALETMYEYYSLKKDMLENVLRDTHVVPALMEIIKLKWWPMIEMMVGILSECSQTSKITNSPTDDIKDNNLVKQQDQKNKEFYTKASLRVALDFFTWQKLSVSGLSNKKAANLAASWVKISRNNSH